MSAGTRLSQLLSVTKSIPLPELRQGGTLSIRSSINIPLKVRFIPQWRDDAHLKLEQTLPPKRTRSNAITYSDTDEEMDLRILKDVVTNKQGSLQIAAFVEYKKRRVPSFSNVIQSSMPFFGLTNKHEETNKDDIEKIITDDGSFHSQHDLQTQQTARQVSYNDGITHNTNSFPHSIDRPPPSVTLTAKIPENCNVSCILNGAGGDIDVSGKLEGEDGFEFSTSGNINLTKLRGNSISLTSSTRPNESNKIREKAGIIHVKKSLEAQDLNVQVNQGGRFRAKLINISNANIEVTDSYHPHFEALDEDDDQALIDIGSLYASQSGDGANLSVLLPPLPYELHQYRDYSKKVRVKSNHGHLSIRTTTYILDSHLRDQNCALVLLGGVNGSFDVLMESKTSSKHISRTVQHEKNSTKEYKFPLAAKIHMNSLSPRQTCFLKSDFGNAELTFDEKVKSDLRLLSSPLIKKLDATILMGENEEGLLDSLAAHGKVIKYDHHKPHGLCCISMLVKDFREERCFYASNVKYLRGFIQDESASRFNVKSSAGSVGKIRIEGAAVQALAAFSDVENDSDRNADLDGEIMNRPLIVVAMDGSIKVERLSWFGAIARRHGVSEEKIASQAQLDVKGK